ncbi:MAG: hypothetical protein AAF184_09835 [Pseudomonadota bacterium]
MSVTSRTFEAMTHEQQRYVEQRVIETANRVVRSQRLQMRESLNGLVCGDIDDIVDSLQTGQELTRTQMEDLMTILGVVHTTIANL